MHKKIEINYFIILAIGFVIGIFTTLLIKKYSHFSIENNISLGINPIELISILINILIAYYLTVVFGKKNDIHKSEKDLLITYFEDFRKDKDLIISECSDLILNGTHNNHYVITSQLKYLRQKLNMNLTLLIERKFITQNNIIKQNAESKMKNIWEKITYTPTASQLNFNIENQLFNARTLSTDLDKLLFELIIIINDK